MMTGTVSICVNDHESTAIRNAAQLAGQSVSAWAAARIAKATSSGPLRAKAKAAVDRLAAEPTPRGSRKLRISAILKEPVQTEMLASAGRFKISAHALAQAILIEAAEDELVDAPEDMLKGMADQRAATATVSGSTAVIVPQGTSQNRGHMAEVVTELLSVMRDQIMDGNGPKIRDGVLRTAARIKAGETMEIRLNLPKATLAAIAHVLDVPEADLATAFAFKATKA